MRPVTLCFSGLDPSGGAGLQADIETIAALGGHAAVIATALTVQDSQRVYDFQLTEPALMQAQASRILADLPVACIKLGMLGSAATVTTVLDSLAAYRHLPVVLDPVLSANSGGALAQGDLRAALLKALPHISIITPNSIELRLLAGCQNLDQAVARLTEAGAAAIWLKGGHEPGATLINSLYVQGRLVMRSELQRLPGEFHGSGCTLAAALAAGLAAGLSLQDAVEQSQDFVSQALALADRPRDQGQWLPRRIVKTWQRSTS
ncbi:MAG: hydroxymethylpyrimidine/phosphomethylpyrimidine kinase [Pseudomonadota bacterium]